MSLHRPRTSPSTMSAVQRLSIWNIITLLVILLDVCTSVEHRLRGERSKRSHSQHGHSQQSECQTVADGFRQLKLGDHGSHPIPLTKIHDPNLEICGNAGARRTCCTRPIEHKLHEMAMDDMHEVIASTSSYLKNLLTTSTELYQGQFLEVLTSASNSTKISLESVYKIRMDDHGKFVDDLFTSLIAYVNRVDGEDIERSMTRFFDELFSVVYLYSLSDMSESEPTMEYAECLKSARKDLDPSPFGENSVRLSGNVVKSLGVARALLEAFDLAIETINTTDTLGFEHQCSRALTRLQYCSHCEGMIDVRPCKSLCMNVVQGCLAQVADINSHWNLFVSAVESLVYNMRGQYDIQEVMYSFHSKVSNSILHAMSDVHRYHSQVVSKCGHPKSTSSHPSQLVSPTPKLHPSVSLLPPIRRTDVSLYLKISMFIQNLAASKGFYNKLPDTVCSSERLSAGNYDTCWNGTALASYNKSVTSLVFSTQVAENPEMRVPETKSSTIVNLVDKLDHMTKLLHSRIVSRKSAIQSDSSMIEAYSGEGWQSGGGRHPYGWTGDDEDDYESGSASSGNTNDLSESSSEKAVIPSSSSDFGFNSERPTSRTPSPYITSSSFQSSQKVTKAPSRGTTCQPAFTVTSVLLLVVTLQRL